MVSVILSPNSLSLEGLPTWIQLRFGSFDHTSDHLLTTLHTVVNTTKQIVRDSDSMDKISLSFIFILVVFFSGSPTVNNKSELRTLS